MTKDGIKLDGN